MHRGQNSREGRIAVTSRISTGRTLPRRTAGSVKSDVRPGIASDHIRESFDSSAFHRSDGATHRNPLDRVWPHR